MAANLGAINPTTFSVAAEIMMETVRKVDPWKNGNISHEWPGFKP
jgi:hypothetical protein